jgi:hypothetical protein
MPAGTQNTVTRRKSSFHYDFTTQYQLQFTLNISRFNYDSNFRKLKLEDRVSFMPLHRVCTAMAPVAQERAPQQDTNLKVNTAVTVEKTVK